eukprot:2289033-Prymnesium_polylepis.1
MFLGQLPDAFVCFAHGCRMPWYVLQAIESLRTDDEMMCGARDDWTWWCDRECVAGQGLAGASVCCVALYAMRWSMLVPHVSQHRPSQHS